VGECIRIGLVDADPIFREGVAQALRAFADIAIAAEGGTAGDALGMVADAVADILLVEIGMSDRGVALAGVIRRAKSEVKVVVLTASNHDDHVVEALRAGAKGYILKNVTRDDLVCAIRSINQGDCYITPALASRLLSRLVAQAGNKSLLANSKPTGRDDLTCREQEVLGHLCQGLSNREIAVKLGISVKTIKQHTMLLFSKMGVRNRIEAIVAGEKHFSKTGNPGVAWRQ